MLCESFRKRLLSLVQFRDEAGPLFFEGFAVVFDFLGADVAAGGEDVAVGGDFFKSGRFAEAGDVFVFACTFFSSPGMVGTGDFGNVIISQFAMHAIEQVEQALGRYGRGRYTLWTGDLGTALYLHACLTGTPAFPTIDYF